jgi:hypothetical protein
MIRIKKNKHAEATSQPMTLYVILHGEIVMIDDQVPNSAILVMAPEVPGHAYQAGPWLGEVKIDRDARLYLTGVVLGGKKSIFSHPDRSVLFQNVPLSTTPPYFAILLPRPEDILPGYIMQLGPGLIKDLKPDTVKIIGPNGTNVPTGMDLHTIFKYTVKDPDRLPALRDAFSGEPLFFPGGGRENYLSLHIYAAEQFVPAPPEHVGAAINATSALLGIQATIDPDAQGGTAPPVFIHGLDVAEYTVPLGIRTSLLGEIGRKHRTGTSADLAEAFRMGWEPGRDPPHMAWITEGTCGNIGASPADGQSTKEYLRAFNPNSISSRLIDFANDE